MGKNMRAVALTNNAKILVPIKAQSNVNSRSQLKAAKDKWQEAIAQLETIGKNTLVGDRVSGYKSDFQKQIDNLDARIASLSAPSPAVSSRQKSYIKTYVRPRQSPVRRSSQEPKPPGCVF
jgi:uncharacterized protein (DUF885 family)